MAKTMILEDRDNGNIVTMPLAHITAILDRGKDADIGKALKTYLGPSFNTSIGKVNDLVHLQAICNWSPENAGVPPTEMAKRLGLASKIIVAEREKAKEIVLDDIDFEIIVAIINNEQYQIRPNSGYWSFLLALQELYGQPLFKSEEKTK